MGHVAGTPFIVKCITNVSPALPPSAHPPPPLYSCCTGTLYTHFGIGCSGEVGGSNIMHLISNIQPILSFGIGSNPPKALLGVLRYAGGMTCIKIDGKR